MIRIDAMWLAAEPVDMRAGADRLIARVVEVNANVIAAAATMPQARVARRPASKYCISVPPSAATP